MAGADLAAAGDVAGADLAVAGDVAGADLAAESLVGADHDAVKLVTVHD